ncbi:adenylate kinase-domain-containing protein [Lipomyces kononenkoae]|uniref:Adenylate kinase-domain-containing protein n=1 Tax=Lipomyces kononenkoae TaxID=34357 RepID=A0ACC3T1Y3_LIPKO
MTRLSRPARVLLLGPPGSGKGTQTERLLKRFAIPGISSGDILRRHIRDGTEIGVLASSITSQGKLLPDNLMTKVVASELGRRRWLSPSMSWLLDGFPRTEAQANMLDAKELEPAHAGLNFVVELKVPEDVMVERIANRLVHVPSGRVYNLTYNPPKVPGHDDITGEPLTRRPDDDPEVFRKRIKEYRASTEPLLEYYSKTTTNVLWSVAGETSDAIFERLETEVVRRFGEKVDHEGAGAADVRSKAAGAAN